jgi:Uma2 family endonuclease
MATGTLISEEQYLHTSYEPECEFEDGVLFEKAMGTLKHAKLQSKLVRFIGNRGRVWKLDAYSELTFKIRSGKYMIPDIAVVADPQPESSYADKPPLIWIEILSPDDRHVRVSKKVQDVLAFGTPYVWVIDPETLESELHTPQGMQVLEDGVLRIPGTPIEVPLAQVLED